MKLTRLNRILIATGVMGMVATGVVSAISTYKAYPKIKEAKDGGAKPMEIVKIAAKDYIPAAGVVVLTSAAVVASEALGERKLNELKYKFDSLTRKYEKVGTWYKDQTKAIEDKLSDKNKKAIEEGIKEIEEARYDHTSHTEISTFYDPFTFTTFESTEGDVLLAVNEAINRNLMIHGYATYEDYYGYLGLDVPDDYKNFGWSFSTASAMWCNPWVDIKFVADTLEDGSVVKTIEYVSEYGKGDVMPFEPVEEPQSEGWN